MKVLFNIIESGQPTTNMILNNFEKRLKTEGFYYRFSDGFILAHIDYYMVINLNFIHSDEYRVIIKNNYSETELDIANIIKDNLQCKIGFNYNNGYNTFMIKYDEKTVNGDIVNNFPFQDIIYELKRRQA